MLAWNKDKQRDAAGEEGPSVTYHLRSKFSMPSRNDEQILEVAKLEMMPDYYFKVYPHLNEPLYTW